MRVLNGSNYIKDDFSHEQYLVVRNDGKSVLLSGCAHNGIVNILDKYSKLFKSMPSVVISGFHLMNKNGYSDDDIRNIEAIADELKKTGCIFYTGHCTGAEPYKIMKQIMGEQLKAIHSGMTIIV